MSRKFNGTTQSLSAAIDFSSENTLSFAFWLWWDAFDLDNDVGFEFTNPYFSNNGGFIFGPDANLNGGTILVGLRGNSGLNYATYTRPTAAAWHHYVAIYDMSQAANEVDLYIDGSLQIPVARPATNNNTGSFANDTLYLMSRGNASLFGPGQLADFTIYNSRLTTADVIQLSKRYTGRFISQQNILYHFPFVRDNDVDLYNGLSLSATGTPTVDVHPPMIYPYTPHISYPVAVAPPTGAIMNQLQKNNLGADLFNGSLS